MQQESYYGFTIGEEVICNGKTDVIIGFLYSNNSEYKQGYRLILKEEGNQSLSTVKRKLVKWEELYGQNGEILLPQVRYHKNREEINKVSRLEVISNTGRQYVNMDVNELELSYQDDGRTLKIFLK